MNPQSRLHLHLGRTVFPCASLPLPSLLFLRVVYWKLTGVLDLIATLGFTLRVETRSLRVLCTGMGLATCHSFHLCSGLMPRCSYAAD